ncbi:hypothetical protein ZIOFF_063984 [Zingiber officinale]|uniref:Uncharacterized protein n=1 Tax=Zingiber officinale TaxID=94328 RepID=A0A8J5FBY7_ZINOF|nr:hypothetical protein ZIOFF_063984 [Zingiber officinale]
MVLADFSQIQRVVFLVDLHPLLDLQDPTPYIASIVSAARRVVSFAPIASSLFAYKLFFSSLSPLLSTSKVHRLLGKSPTFLCFDRPVPTLDSLSRTLASLRSAFDPSTSAGHGSSKAPLLAESLLQLEHDYGWESHPQDRKCEHELLVIRSNLVLLLSPFSQNLDFGLEDGDLESGEECCSAMSSDALVRRFNKCFALVKERLVSRDIHLCWVDVNLDYLREEVPDLRVFCRGIREMGWGFCPTDAIVLGSVFVPFGLIFPNLGCSMSFEVGHGDFRKGNSDLVLEIVDVKGKPLKCNTCSLQVIDLDMITERSESRSSLNSFSSEPSTIYVKGICSSDTEGKIANNSSTLYLLRGVSGDSGKASQGDKQDEFFADKVLELLCGERGVFVAGKPIWQIFLNFLYRRNYWAVVSVSDSEDHSIQGILMPFTPNHALLAIKKNNLLNPGQLIVKKTKRIIEMRESFTEKNEMLNAPASAESKEEPTRRNNKMHQNQIQNATLNSFRKMAFSKETDSLGFDLEQLYFSRNSDKSKKLKFLKCWMRQIVKSNSDCQFIWDDLTEHLDTKEDSQIRTAVSDSQIRTAASQDEPEPDVIPSSMDDAYPSGSPNNDMAMLQHMEDTDAFLRGIPQKIQQGLCSQDADLGMLAERIVDLCIRALDMQFNENTKNLFSDEAGDASYGKIANELSHLLLMKPKDLTLKYKVMNSANNASQNAVSDLYTRELVYSLVVIRHELQILLRMELLCSIVAPNIEEDAKQKMIKEICSLLQFIDINLQGESFGYQHIVDYTERTIKQRYFFGTSKVICVSMFLCLHDMLITRLIIHCIVKYSHCLGEIICKIYNQMEFNLFDDEVEASDSLPSSNNEEFKRLNEHTVGATGFGMQQEEMQNKQQRRLIKAQELRDRERRLSSFTSFIPDLKKVWAPKRLKAERLTHDSQTKLSKRRRRVSTSDRVCETPMTGLKNHSRVQADGSSCQVSNSKPFSKALFHHDSELNSDAAL